MKISDLIFESERDPFEEDQLTDHEILQLLRHRAAAIFHRVERMSKRLRDMRRPSPLSPYYSGCTTTPGVEEVGIMSLLKEHTTRTNTHTRYLDTNAATPMQVANIKKQIQAVNASVKTYQKLVGKVDRLRRKLASAVTSTSLPARIPMPGRPGASFDNPAVVFSDRTYAGPVSLYSWPGKATKAAAQKMFEFLEKYLGVDARDAIVYAGRGREYSYSKMLTHIIVSFANGQLIWTLSDKGTGSLYMPSGHAYGFNTYIRDYEDDLAAGLNVAKLMTQNIADYNSKYKNTTP